MSLIPGDRLIANYTEVLASGAGNSQAAVGRMLFNSLVMALTVAIGKIAISLISAFAKVADAISWYQGAAWAYHHDGLSFQGSLSGSYARVAGRR
mgnify:CR=1 FL=1